VVSKPFDPTLKDLVECGPEDWVALAGLPPAPTRIIDADVATVSGAADKALHVAADPPYLLHLEFLAGHDTAEQPRLLHKRNLLLEDRHDLPVRTVLVVLRPEADSPLLTGLRQRTFPGEAEPYTTFRYDVIRVWQVPAARFLAGGLGTLPLALVAAVTRAELPGIIQQMETRVSGRRRRPPAPQLWAATYILMGLRYSSEVAQELLRGVVSMKESSTYQAILREGWEEGLRLGKEEGALGEARKMLLLLGERRFGPPDAQTRAALENIQDRERLEAMIVRHQQAADWQDLLTPRAPRRRNGRRRST
jgi:predicted transposase YdaD